MHFYVMFSIKFSDHVEKEHNLWHYLYFQIYVEQKAKDELTFVEKTLLDNIARQAIDYFPLEKALSLPQSEQDEDVTEKVFYYLHKFLFYFILK